MTATIGSARCDAPAGCENSQFAYAARLRQAVPAARRWLDVGCGHEFLQPWMPEPYRRLELNGCRPFGVDLDFEALRRHDVLTRRVCADAEALPFASGAFDLITANMVLEHVREPLRLFREIARVLAPGGRFLAHTPNRHGYTTACARLVPERAKAALAGVLHGRAAADVYPAVYAANTKRTLSRLAQGSGLQLVECDYIGSSAQLDAVPIARDVERLLLRVLKARVLGGLRPCLLAAFEKP